MMTQMFHVFQTNPDDVIDTLVCSSPNITECQDEVDRINSHLQDRGIPSDVSCAYLN